MLPGLRQEGFCRSPAHCIEYVHLIQWQHERGAEEFDADEEEHMRWVYDRACQRAEHFGIQVMFFARLCSCHSCASTVHAVPQNSGAGMHQDLQQRCGHQHIVQLAVWPLVPTLQMFYLEYKASHPGLVLMSCQP